MTTLEMYRGDKRILEVALTLDGVAWNPPGDAILKATGKRSLKDTDAEAVWAKHSDVGGTITVLANVASIVLEPADTENCATNQSAEELFGDVQVTSPTVGPWTVAAFKLKILPDVTRAS